MFRAPVILCAVLASQVLAAPKPDGCIESCTTYNSHQTHEALIRQQTAALNELRQVSGSSQLGGLDYARPGNWTDVNEYRTDGGRGRVYEEQGQVVSGPRRVQYYKKKYSSSSHGGSTDADALRRLGGVASTLDSQRLTSGVASTLDSQHLTGGVRTLDSQRLTGGHRSTYDERRRHEVHESTNRVVGNSERLEDFGERVDGTQQVIQGVPSSSARDNWHRADSWRTDGGRGVVHEEEGQVVNGPTKVKYYRQNYSSSYSSGDTGAAGAVPSIGEPNLDAELQRLHSTLDSLGREIHHSTVGQSSVSQTVGQTGYVDENRLTTNVRPGRPGIHTSYADESVLSATNVRPQTGHTSSYVDENVLSTTNVRPQTGHTSSYVDESLLSTTNVRPQPVHVQQETRRHHSTIRHGVVVDETPSSSGHYHPTRPDYVPHADDVQQTQAPLRYPVVSRPHTTVRKSETHQVYEETAAPQRHVVLTNSDGRIRDDRIRDDRTRGPLVHVPIHTANSDYRAFHSNGEVRGNQLVATHARRLTAEEIRQAQIMQDRTLSQNVQRENSYGNADVETVNVVAQQPAAVNRYEEKWSEGYRSHSTVPQQSLSQVHGNYVQTGRLDGQVGSYGNSHSSRSRHESGSHFYEGFRTPTDQLVTGGLSLGSIGQTSGHTGSLTMGTIGQSGADCDQAQGVTTSEQFQYGSVSHRKFKREADPGLHDFVDVDLSQHSHQVEDLTQQTAGFDDFYRQHPHRDQHSQQTEDLTQQTGDFDHFGQHTSGHLEFGQETQQTEDLTQQTSGFDGLSQQTSGHLGHLEFGQETQQTEDLTQQTSGFDGLSQQTSGHLGHLEFGQETQQTEDLTQQTSGFDGLSQHTSGHLGHLEFGQETQQTEDLTQQTSGFDGLSQQTANLELGHQQHVGKLEFGQETQQTEDLTQQTSGFDGLSQQTSGNLEFGHHEQQQQQQHSGKLEFGQATQQVQQTGDLANPETLVKLDFNHETDNAWVRAHEALGHQRLPSDVQQSEDLTQQTSGKLEFGQQQQSHSGKRESGHQAQQTEDLTQQTSEHPEFGQQHQTHSGKLEFGHQDTQQTEDLTQQTGGFDDFTQQTSGNLEFGQQHQTHSGKLEFGHQETQQTEDLTQQTSGHLEFGQHQQTHSGKLEFGDQETQQTEDLTQQTGGFDDFTLQTSGNLEFGQHSQQTDDLTQQTGGRGDQTSGDLEFGHQHHQHSGDHESGHQHHQHSGDHESRHRHHQHSGNHEFGHEHHQHSGDHESGHQHHQHPGNHEFGHEHHQHSGDHESGRQHHQHTGDHEFGHDHHQHSGSHDFGQDTQKDQPLTQQTVPSHILGGNVQQTSVIPEFGQEHGKLVFGQDTQQTEDLTQQTGGFDDITQQTSGKLESGQQHQQHQTGKLEFGQETQQTEDLTQQTGGFGDFTQQTSGNLEFGQQHQHDKHELGQETQQTEDLTQQTGGFNDFTQQTSGNLEFGQQHQQQQTGKLEFGQQHQQQQTGKLEFGQQHQQQQTGKLEFGQQHQQHPAGKLEFGQQTQQTEDMTQQTGGFDDFTQQTSGNLEFGQQHQQHPSGKLEFGQETQQTDDLTQQTGGFGDFTQQTSGNLEFGQQHQHGKHEFGQQTQQTQQTQDMTQQTGGFGDFTQQTSGSLEFGQHTQQPDVSSQQTGGFGGITQQSSANQQLGQEHQQPGIFDVSETTTTPRPRKVYSGVKGGRRRKPAAKPTLRPGRRHGMSTEKPDEIEEPLNEYDPSRYHKNDAQDVPSVLGIDEPETEKSRGTSRSPNAQWHQTHRPGDLTNSESHRFVPEPQVTQNMQQYPAETRQDRQNSPIGQENSDQEIKVEPRIVEAYGGAGAYDADHNDDLFSGAKRDPSVTLPPNGEEPWFIREKPIEPFNRRPIFNQPPETTTTAMPETTTTAAPSFWNRVGHRLTSTYEKAKEKATNIFGK